MSPLAAVRVHLLAAVVLLAGCAGAFGAGVRSVQVVADPQDGTQRGRTSPEVVSPEGLAPDDRLLLVHVGYANPLKFRNWLYLIQVSPGSKREGLVTTLHIPLDGESGDRLLLLRFKAEGGDAARIYPYACLSSLVVACNIPGLRDSYLYVKLPPAGGVAYLGRVQFRVEDIYPHRGTQNHPQVKGLVVLDSLNEDAAAAKQRWPVLNGRPIARSPVQVQS